MLDQSEFLTAKQNSVYICMKYEYIPPSSLLLLTLPDLECVN